MTVSTTTKIRVEYKLKLPPIEGVARPDLIFTSYGAVGDPTAAEMQAMQDALQELDKRAVEPVQFREYPRAAVPHRHECAALELLAQINHGWDGPDAGLINSIRYQRKPVTIQQVRAAIAATATTIPQPKETPK